MKHSMTIAILLFGLGAFAQEIVVKSESISTCYQKTNTALLQAISETEQQALEQCSAAELTKLQTKIKPGSCGYVQVIAKYNCEN